MVRSVIWILLLSSISTASLAGTRDELVMPFECGLEGGRVKLTPGGERRYAIVGARERQTITTCHGPGPAACRTITVHRFDMSCGGAGVSWMRVAAAMRRAADAPAWIEGGRLHLVLPTAGSTVARPKCIDGPAFALGRGELQRRVAQAPPCPADAERGSFDHILLPAGFAPVDELKAWLIAADPGGPFPKRAGHNAVLTAVSANAGETLIAKVDSETLVAPIPGLEPYEPVTERQRAAAGGDRWVTTVQSEPARERGGARLDVTRPDIWAWLICAMAFATAAGLLRMRFAHTWPSRGRPVTWRLASVVAGLKPSGARGAQVPSPIRNFSSAGAAVAALLEQTETIVIELKGAGPLREVLRSELKRAGERLASIEATAAGGEADAAKTGMQLRALVRELERIRRIAQSAAASLSRARPATTLPRTTAEAYDVLGINPDVSEDVLKKIVDALRMSWHPDHARRDEDRQEREHRIRQINVAWELITATREAA